jgi:predicted DNA-binding protein
MEKEKTIISIQVPKELKEMIKEISEQEDRPLAAQVRFLLKKGVERYNARQLKQSGTNGNTN